MPDQVLVACNSFNATENASFRMEYRVVGVGHGHFDWQPTFGHTNSQHLAALFARTAAVVLERHGLTITEEEVINIGVPIAGTPSGTLHSIITLTNAQIKALPSTPITVVAAPGANKIINFLNATARMHWAADYTNIDAGALLKFSVGTSSIAGDLREDISSSVSGFLAGGGPDGIWANFNPRGRVFTSHQAAFSGYYDSDIGNQPLTFSADNQAAGAFTGGHSSNTMKLTVFYSIIDY